MHEGNSQALPALELAFWQKRIPVPSVSLPFSSLQGTVPEAYVHPGQSQDHHGGPWLHRPLSFQASSTAGAGAWALHQGAFCPAQITGRPQPLPLINLLPATALLLSRRGEGPAQPRLWFLFHSIRPPGSGPPCPLPGYNRGIPLTPTPAPLQTPCVPRFGHLEASLGGGWGWGTA